MWVTRYPADPDKALEHLYGITAFACGLKAEEISGMRESSVVLAALRQMDEMFGESQPLTDCWRLHEPDRSADKNQWLRFKLY